MGRSLAEAHPELVCEWSGRNAPLKATDITYGSNKKYWWIGKCGHEWLASPKDRHAGERYHRREKTHYTRLPDELKAKVKIIYRT